PLLPDYQTRYVLVADETAARAAVAREELSRLLVIPEDYLATGNVTIITNAGAFTFAELDESDELDRFFREHLLRHMDDALLRDRLLDPFNPAIVDAGGEVQGDGNPLSMVLGFVVPYMLSIFLIITIFVSSGYLLRSVSEEKTTRVIEIVLSSVSAQELLAEQILGLGGPG